ncbi:hypothetical protein D3C78_1227270 [compost metagenome]
MAPALSEPNRSNIDISWCGGVTEIITSSAVTAQRCRVWPITLAVARLLSTTHFGLPVVPEVYR